MRVAEAIKISLDDAFFESVVNAPAVKDDAPTLEQIRALEHAIPKSGLDLYDIDSLTSHHFCEGLYARQLDVPSGAIVVGKMHAKENFFLLAKGEMTVWTEKGMRRVSAPFLVVTKPGDKRVGYAHEDCVTYNFHANQDNETDLTVLESRYIVDEMTGNTLENKR